MTDPVGIGGVASGVRREEEEERGGSIITGCGGGGLPLPRCMTVALILGETNISLMPPSK